MKIRIFTLMMAFLAVASGAVWGQDDGYTVLTSNNPVTVDGPGPYYFTTNGQEIENGGIRVTGDSKIYLKDVNIKVGGSAIMVGPDITDNADLTLVLQGENKITSEGTSAAIKIGANNSGLNATLTISEESTGILDIEMAENRRDEMVAIGNTGAAGNMCISGTLTINGGTIKTNGYFGEFDTRGLFYGGNAVIIAKGFDAAGWNDLRSGGLIFLDDDTPYVGEFHTPDKDSEFTLNSPLPEPYKIT